MTVVTQHTVPLNVDKISVQCTETIMLVEYSGNQKLDGITITTDIHQDTKCNPHSRSSFLFSFGSTDLYYSLKLSLLGNSNLVFFSLKK